MNNREEKSSNYKKIRIFIDEFTVSSVLVNAIVDKLSERYELDIKDEKEDSRFNSRLRVTVYEVLDK